MNYHWIGRLAKRTWLLLLLALALGSAPAPVLNASDAPPTRAEGRNSIAPLLAPVLQFTAAGHVLGFQRDGMYVASADHMLKVTFANARAVEPVADLTEPALTLNEVKGKGLKPVRSSAAQTLTRVTYANVWDGIDVCYEAVSGGIVKSTYVVAPGADVSQIHLRYNVPVAVEPDGGLRFAFERGAMRESAPFAWQEINGERVPVRVAFAAHDSQFAIRNSRVGFTVGEYDRAYPLVIDPTLAWHTFLGSVGSDYGRGIAVDGNGNVYVVGESWNTWGTPVNAFVGGGDAFVAKLNSSGVRQWNTFMGSSSDDYGKGIAVDVNGNVYIVGYSGATWGTPINAFAGAGMTDAFVAKLNNSGIRQWHTFMGSAGSDEGWGIAVDGSANVYVVGLSFGTWGTPVNAYAGAGDAFAAKLNSDGARQWNTFMGSRWYSDAGKGVAVDGSGNVYVVGDSGDTWGTPVNAFAGNNEAFVAKLDNSGARQWNTFMGSYFPDWGSGIAVDGSGNIYVVGTSTSGWGTPVNAHAGGWDMFVAKLSSGGARQWNTFMGSSGLDESGGVAVASGNVYVAGRSDAAWGTPVNPYAGGLDAFAAKLNSSGVRQWHTFMGSSDADWGNGIAVHGVGNIYIVGESLATWGTPVNAFVVGTDAFVAKLVDVSCYLWLPIILR